MTTVLEVIDKGTAYLEKRNIENARLNMQLLVAHHLGCSRMDLYLRFDEPLTDEQLQPIRSHLKQRGERIPLQHLLGSVEFCRREFKTDSRALIPRPETEELVSLILHQAHTLNKPTRLLDLGTGSGILGITLALELPQVSEAVLSDISPDALALAQENAATHQAEFTLIESNLFQNLTGTFDLIVANLPYVPEIDRPTLAPELAHDPDLALFSGPDGLDLLRQFIPLALQHLNPNGLLALEIGHNQHEKIAELLKSSEFQEIDIRSDLSGISRFPFARKPEPKTTQSSA
ncbi:MAG: peptide chain release factor N(5)-glutamine methyltransferase [Verrucomicrobiota bacterium]